MKIETAIEVFREMLDETRNYDGTMCNQPYYCKAFPKDRERTNKCPFGTCEACERIVAFNTIVGFVNKAQHIPRASEDQAGSLGENPKGAAK